jgi:NAD(P)-dependent dehydrogenase (short-subunit alcohol dehydrogenase family)
VAVNITLNGQVVVVTGAARGIGRAIAAACARRGAEVVAIDRLADEPTAAASALRAEGLPIDPRTCELTDDAAVARLFKAVAGDHGRIEGLVNNAGTTIYGGALDDCRRRTDVHAYPLGSPRPLIPSENRTEGDRV